MTIRESNLESKIEDVRHKRSPNFDFENGYVLVSSSITELTPLLVFGCVLGSAWSEDKLLPHINRNIGLHDCLYGHGMTLR